jgi:K+-transporting ATPase ATPase A chain
MVSSQRQGVALLAVMAGLWGAMLAVIWAAEAHGPAATGAAMEGKEVRFGIPSSALFADTTTGTSTGAVNSLHDSYTAFGGGGALLNMLFGELSPGGVGTGLYSILVVAIIAVFLAGLMVGRTPEYLGKSLGRREVTCAAVVVLVMPALVLLGTGMAAVLPSTSDALTNSGPHGLSEIFYAFASASNNNGSAFGGLTVTGGFWQVALGLAMILGRFLPIVAVLALAGLLAAQPARARSAGTLRTDTPLFSVLVASTVVLVAAITFLPALALSPIAEGLS